MFARLAVLFIIVPAMELLIIIETGRYLGFWNTFLLLISLGLLGIFLVMNQGFSVVRKIKKEISQGRLPTNSLLEGLFILISGILLITPGLLTDLLGLLLLLPPIRRFLRKRVIKIICMYLLPGKLLRIHF